MYKAEMIRNKKQNTFGKKLVKKLFKEQLAKASRKSSVKVDKVKAKKTKISKTKTDRTKTDLNEILRNSHFTRPSGHHFWDFLTQEKIPYVKKHFPFLSSHAKPKIRKIFDFEEYMKISSRGEALSYLYGGFGKSLNYVGPVLDLDMKHGFNDHTDRHTLWVSQTGVELLQRAGASYCGTGYYDSETEVLMTLVGMTHDLGNFISRKEHSTYSAWLLTRLFGNTGSRRKEFEAVLHSILFHEESVLLESNLDIEKGTPLQWALVAADKMHVGRDRVGSRSFQSGIENGALEEDSHIVLNALIVRSTWYLGVRTFVWHLGFSIDQLEEKFASFTTGNKRLYLPKFFQKVFLQNGIIYRESYVRLFRKIYIHRMKLAAKCVFLLFPHINEFKVELADNDTRAKVGSGKMIVFKIRRKQLF